MIRKLLCLLPFIVSFPLCPQDLYDFFDCEGIDPVIDGGTLVFSALESQYLSSHGHGWRNELKKRKELRMKMKDTSEQFSCRITLFLQEGTKTIVTQYHGEGTETLLLVYVSDFASAGLMNGTYGDGVFDVYAKYINPLGAERIEPIGTIRSGETARYSFENDRGTVRIGLNNEIVVLETKKRRMVYLKFGDYLQAQDPISKRFLAHDEYSEFYERIGTDRIMFEDFEYSADP